jgi:nucleoside triphosphate diphosphatase
MNNLKEELGICFFKLFFTPASPRSADTSDFGGVVEAITQKKLRRHPHVFGTARGLSPDEVKTLWEKRIKRDEKREETVPAPPQTAGPAQLDPRRKIAGQGFNRGFRLERCAAGHRKIREETDEIEAALDAGDAAAIVEEIGDLLFSTANLARHVKADPGRCHPPGERQVRMAIPLHRGGAGTRRHGAWRRGSTLEPSEARRKARNWHPLKLTQRTRNEIFLSMALG